MAGSKLLSLVMPSQYRQGFTYTLKSGRIFGNTRRVIKKAGQTMLRRTLKREMLNELNGYDE